MTITSATSATTGSPYTYVTVTTPATEAQPRPTDPPQRIVAIIPARGGSSRVKRKNLLPIGGVPLVIRAARACRVLGGEVDEVVVCTEDDEIAAVAEAHVISVLRRSPEEALTTIDDHTIWLRGQYPDAGLLIYQPTVVGVQPSDILKLMSQKDSATLVSESRHRNWHGNFLKERSRAEVGVRWYPPPTWGDPAIPVIASGQTIDIDHWSDVVAARSLVSRRRVHIEIAAHPSVGYGHMHRTLALAEELQGYDVTFSPSGSGALDTTAESFLLKRGWKIGSPTVQDHKGPGVWVCDHLDTDLRHIGLIRSLGWQVVTMEDLGPGARLADFVVNEMYPHPDPLVPQVVGPRWAVMRPEFLGHTDPALGSGVDVLVSFGGTDPAHLTEKVVHALEWGEAQPGDVSPKYLRVTVVSPPGRPLSDPRQGESRLALTVLTEVPSMARLMLDHDILICSAGRTVTEAAVVGLPAIVLAQNTREATHTHLGPEFGNVYLGLGTFVPSGAVREVVQRLLGDWELRSDLARRARGTIDGLGLRRIVRRIEDLMEGL